MMPGLINVDFADVRTIMTGMGRALMGSGFGKGDKRALEAAQSRRTEEVKQLAETGEIAELAEIFNDSTNKGCYWGRVYIFYSAISASSAVKRSFYKRHLRD